jgi:hypothetical protein
MKKKQKMDFFKGLMTAFGSVGFAQYMVQVYLHMDSDALYQFAQVSKWVSDDLRTRRATGLIEYAPPKGHLRPIPYAATKHTKLFAADYMDPTVRERIPPPSVDCILKPTVEYVAWLIDEGGVHEEHAMFRHACWMENYALLEYLIARRIDSRGCYSNAASSKMMEFLYVTHRIPARCYQEKHATIWHCIASIDSGCTCTGVSESKRNWLMAHQDEAFFSFDVYIRTVSISQIMYNIEAMMTGFVSNIIWKRLKKWLRIKLDMSDSAHQKQTLFRCNSMQRFHPKIRHWIPHERCHCDDVNNHTKYVKRQKKE